jgi:pyruvate dehydrogenase E2 component (dihydrolipoamide acetyltransferase)
MVERVFTLPDLGEGLEEAEIAGWLVSEGQAITLDQPLLEVETAKATVEIPSPRAGRVGKIHAEAGSTVKVGEPLVTFEVEEVPTETNVLAPSSMSSMVQVGDEPAGPRAASRVPPATPAVRRLAKDLGVDLSAVAGSGPGGRITREDVEGAARGAGTSEPSLTPEDVEVVPISAIRRTIAENLTRVVRDVPLVTTFRTLDCTSLEAFRRDLGVSPLPVVARALAEVCGAHPYLNASYRAEEGRIELFQSVHMGIATDTERGLVVPVIRDVASLGLGAVAEEIARLAVLARDGRLSPTDMRGGTITITNTGSYGSEWGTPIPTPGQGAIVALGVIQPRALVVDGRVQARPSCTLSLTFDHRLLDGATAGRAFGDLVDLLQDRERLERLPR